MRQVAAVPLANNQGTRRHRRAPPSTLEHSASQNPISRPRPRPRPTAAIGGWQRRDVRLPPRLRPRPSPPAGWNGARVLPDPAPNHALSGRSLVSEYQGRCHARASAAIDAVVPWCVHRSSEQVLTGRTLFDLKSGTRPARSFGRIPDRSPRAHLSLRMREDGPTLGPVDETTAPASRRNAVRAGNDRQFYVMALPHLMRSAFAAATSTRRAARHRPLRWLTRFDQCAASRHRVTPRLTVFFFAWLIADWTDSSTPVHHQSWPLSRRGFRLLPKMRQDSDVKCFLS